MGMAGSLSHRIRAFSIWRVPNLLLESRGLFLGEEVGAITRLEKIRSMAGLAIVAGAIVYYSGLSHLTAPATDRHGTTVTAGTPEGNWLISVVVTAVVAVLVLPLVCAFLVWRAEPAARRATLLQFRWPLIAIGGWFGIFAVASPLIALGTYATSATKHLGGGARGAAFLLSFFLGIVLLVWIVKALYLAATGLFRADDGHPLLAPIAAPIVAATAAAMMSTTPAGNGLVGEPRTIGYALAWGGTVTIAMVSWISLRIYQRQFPDLYPFRTGPVAARQPAQGLGQPGSRQNS